MDSCWENMHPQDNRYPDYIADQIKKGTTTCALTCSDGVVLAADTRASAGLFIADRHVMKIQRVDTHLAMTIAGGVADARLLLGLLERRMQDFRRRQRFGRLPTPLRRSMSRQHRPAVAVPAWRLGCGSFNPRAPSDMMAPLPCESFLLRPGSKFALRPFRFRLARLASPRFIVSTVVR